ncbi:GrdX family protein [Gemella haemolysans]|jgi:grdX protein|uniref:GrdX family protein n=1 Tax=Gemella haemolysans TaxID=1379 RepID=A0AAW6B5I2_9BACL|nr:GrdX family protein [Gemella haemolysans]MDB6186506.1 GrdX family protein [Gemella haemolysans]MDB6213557.1 GrdX family protein [Gemella haemolysans]MDU1527645.1 GrdX family protein [Gemella haemolysans]MDU4713430.1 GrdX family protein [Gemella haemolysans]
MKLITNNPKFIEENLKDIEIEYLDVSYIDILRKVRDYVHENWEIVTHPLYGSVKPNETIYRTIVIKEKNSLDITSVNLISDAILTFKKFRNNREVPQWTDRVKDDFSVIDHDLIINAINRIL